MVVPYGTSRYVDNRQPARKGTLDMVGRYLSTSLSREARAITRGILTKFGSPK